jgi:hypothetical protein
MKVPSRSPLSTSTGVWNAAVTHGGFSPPLVVDENSGNSFHVPCRDGTLKSGKLAAFFLFIASPDDSKLASREAWCEVRGFSETLLYRRILGG